MYRAPPATRAATFTINDSNGLCAPADSARGFLSFQQELAQMAAVTRPCSAAGPSPKRAHASSQGQAILSPAEADLRYARKRTMAAVTPGPSLKRARASSQGQATMSPAEADLRETRRPRRKRARASPELRKVRRMYTKGVMRILRWGHQQGHRHRSPHVHRRRGTVVGTEAGKSTLSVWRLI